MGSHITLSAGDGYSLGAYRAEPIEAPRGAIVVVQEIFGVNGHIRSVTDGFAELGYLAIAPALFDRVERGVELGYDQEGMTRGRALRGELSMDAVKQDIRTSIVAAADGGKVGVAGYCFGGTVAWIAACRLSGVAASVGYYGGGIYELRDEQPQCPTMLHFGAADRGIPLDQVEAVREAHPDVPLFIYEGAGHGFNCDARGSFHAQAAAQARERTLAFLNKHVG